MNMTPFVLSIVLAAFPATDSPEAQISVSPPRSRKTTKEVQKTTVQKTTEKTDSPNQMLHGIAEHAPRQPLPDPCLACGRG